MSHLRKSGMRRAAAPAAFAFGWFAFVRGAEGVLAAGPFWTYVLIMALALTICTYAYFDIYDPTEAGHVNRTDAESDRSDDGTEG